MCDERLVSANATTRGCRVINDEVCFREAVAILERHGQRLLTDPVSVQAIELLAERTVEDHLDGGEEEGR